MRRTAPALPLEPAPPLSLARKGRHAPWTNPEQKELLSELFSKETLIKSDSAIESAFP